jgi:Tol biopolymer transport system component
MRHFFFNLFFLVVSTSSLVSEEALSNIKQLTSLELGFQKAGEAYFNPDGNLISFQAVPASENDYQIFTLNLNTGEFCKISHGKASCTCSFFHPNGTKILFAASPFPAQHGPPGNYKWDLTPYMNLYESNLDGSDPVALTEGSAYHAECAYSPDGSEIVYASNQDGSMNIYVMKSDGTNVRQLTHTNHCYNGGPFFSPDGEKIIFRADRERPHFLQIYVMDKDGGNLIQLTFGNHVNWAPFWYPTGDAFAYTSSMQGHHNYQIYFQNLQSGITVPITDIPPFNGLPSFSLDGKKILFTSKRGSDRSSQIFIADFEISTIQENL